MEDPDVATSAFRLDPFLDQLRSRLSRLPVEHQFAFATSCCERLYPWYAALASRMGSTDAAKLRTLLDELWGRVLTEPMTVDQLDQLVSRVREIDLGEEDGSDAWDGAVDAVGAVALTLEAWRAQPAENAAKAAGNVLNRVHQQLLTEMLGSTYVVSAPEMAAISEGIAAHPATKRVQRCLLDLLEFLAERRRLTQADLQQVRTLAQAGR